MRDFLTKHFSIASTVAMAGIVGAYCLYENAQRENKQISVICAEVYPMDKAPRCVIKAPSQTALIP